MLPVSDIQERDAHGRTALLVDALRPGSDDRARDKKGHSAFAWASITNTLDAMNWLAEAATQEEALHSLNKHGASAIPKVLVCYEAMELNDAIKSAAAADRAATQKTGESAQDGLLDGSSPEPKRRKLRAL